MTPPMTPREKVELKPCPFCGEEAVTGSNFDNDHYVMCSADCDKCGGMVGYIKTEMAAIENWNRRTALASGSGDHAELAKEIERTSFWREARDSRDFVIDEPCDADDYGAEERPVYADWFRRSVLALLAENAALREDRDQWRIWYRKTSIEINAQDDRATEAERKLAEAVGLLEEILPPVLCGESWGLPDDDVSHQRMSFGWIKKVRTFLSKEAERVPPAPGAEDE